MQTRGNPCVRCGKERILVKQLSEYIGTALTTYTLSTCPDKDCQKEVDRINAVKKERQESLMRKRLAVIRARSNNIHPPKR